jgi:hypothetical protein
MSNDNAAPSKPEPLTPAELNDMTGQAATYEWLAAACVNDRATVRRMLGLDVMRKLCGFLLEEKRLNIKIASEDAAHWAGEFLTRRYRDFFNEQGMADVTIRTSIPSENPAAFTIMFARGHKTARFVWPEDKVYLGIDNGDEHAESVNLERPAIGIIFRYFR